VFSASSKVAMPDRASWGLQGAVGKGGGSWQPEWQTNQNSSKCLHLLRRLAHIGAVTETSPLYKRQVSCSPLSALSLGSWLPGLLAPSNSVTEVTFRDFFHLPSSLQRDEHKDARRHMVGSCLGSPGPGWCVNRSTAGTGDHIVCVEGAWKGSDDVGCNKCVGGIASRWVSWRGRGSQRPSCPCRSGPAKCSWSLKGQ
jgi:hypothetical protein